MTENNEKLYIYGAIVVVAVALIAVLVIIWTPNNSYIKNSLNISKVADNYDKIQLAYYEGIISNLFKPENYSQLYEKIDENWLSSTEYTKESLYNWLVENSIIKPYSPTVVSETAIPSGENYYYRFEIENTDADGQSDNKIVIVNEKRPNEYTISFEQEEISGLSGKVYKYEENGLVFECKITTVKKNIIQYDISAANNGQTQYYIYLNTNNSLVLKLNDGTSVSASDISTVANNEYNFDSGAYFNIKATFTLDLERQNKIESIRFVDSYIGSRKNSIDVFLKEGE